MTSINPKTAVWWNLAFLILTGIAAGTVDFAGLAPSTVSIIKSWASNAAWIVSCVNIVFHLFSSSLPGPMAKLGD